MTLREQAIAASEFTLESNYSDIYDRRLADRQAGAVAAADLYDPAIEKYREVLAAILPIVQQAKFRVDPHIVDLIRELGDVG